MRGTLSFLGVAALTFLGLGGIGGALEGWRAANERERPLAPLCATIDISTSYQDGPPYAAEDGALVHVEGFLRAAPALGTRGAIGVKSYALQQLRVEQGRASRLFRVPNPPRLWLYVDPESEPGASGRVEVRLLPFWTGDEISAGAERGEVGVAGTIPNNVAVALSPEIEAPLPEAGQHWTLWSIAQGERVVVVARARHESGRIVLSSERGQACIVSQQPWPRLMSNANIWATGQFLLGALCLAPLCWKSWKWARRKSPAST